ncbi:MAG: cytochrome c biogenesis protein CcsA [Ignavibacteria bacterium]|nr:cytochrome c biogenesis protein CcsA [Ignavibacteria bacterium]MBT8382449.1 cytochrome c biogenesis protein CcsA [Ignavibacteria bacterium]MBT8392826.1 cytochrome c biogenesis protein CcsA [Ignavibacteria bacterium]NNJ53604.1 cytochrome c biogenesis protein CcsA [Ignavibacteriaceae bacterium]NNL20211.1 cytochrome c biogenesis protein CcsA [Ignavibacteriaceae bacterium]
MVGSIVLTLALAFSVISMVMYFLNYRGYKNTLNYGRIAYHAMAVFVIVASAILWYAILTHQYQYKYVYSYSNNALSGFHLASSFWGGQEGSFMLWLLLTSIVGIILQSYTSKRGDLEPRVMAVFTLATSFLLVMVSPWFKNPFEFIWAVPQFLKIEHLNSNFFELPFMQSFFFTDQSSNQGFIRIDSEFVSLLKSSGVSLNQFIIDGKGLNPQLLNFWMQIHPPILFVGFSMATVPFAFAIAALMKNDYKDWIKQAFPWVLAGMGILGLGIMLGGYWAYEMLGWGGYWAWDPVENSSLIPWLVGVAGIHTLLVQRKSQAKGGIGKYAKTNLILCILTYVLVLYSTFLTRSGVLGDASVHSFVDPGMIIYLFLVLFIGTFTLLGFGMIAYRWRTLSEKIEESDGLLSRELALFTAMIVLSASAIIVFVGTSAPIFGQSVDTFFYNEMHLPLAIIIMFLNGLSLLIKWKKSNTSEVIKKATYSAVGAILFTLGLIIFGNVSDIMIMLLSIATAFALFVNIDIAVKIVKGNMKMLGAYVSHIGIALFILGVIGSAVYSEEVDIDLVKNNPNEAFGYEMTFTEIFPIENNTKWAFNVDVTKGNSEHKMTPVMYMSDFNNSLVREPAILSLLTTDIYLSPLSYEEGKQTQQTGHNHISLQKGNSTEFEGAKITFTRFNLGEKTMQAMSEGNDFQMGAVLTIENDGQTEEVELVRKVTGGEVSFSSFESEKMNLKIELENLTAGNVEIALSPLNGTETEQVHTAESNEVLTVTASIKPFINLVWIGVAVMVIGFIVATSRRLKESLIKS